MRGKTAVARLTPMPRENASRRFGMLKGKIPRLPDEFFFDPLPEEELRLWEGEMRVLFDSHALVWFLLGDNLLPNRLRLQLERPETEFVISAVCIWEISRKSPPRQMAGSE